MVFNQGSRAFTPGPMAPYHSAAETYSAITREQWQNYVNTFVPIENQLIRYATDTTQPLQAMQHAGQDVNASFDAQEGVISRRLRSLGTELSPDEQAASTRSLGLSRSLADVGAQNMARDLTLERQQRVLGNPAPSATAGFVGG